MLWIAWKVLLFWEQITRLAVPYVGMDWARADSFRKLVGGVEEPEELEALRQRLLAGAARSFAVPTTEVAEVFGRCAAFRVYGFVESHAWAFAQYSFASAYLRHQFPAPYLAAFQTGAPGLWPAHTIAGVYGNQARREVLFTLTTLSTARPGDRQWVLAPASLALELCSLSPDEFLHLELTGVTASGRDLLDGYCSHLRDLGCTSLRVASFGLLAVLLAGRSPRRLAASRSSSFGTARNGCTSPSARTSGRPTGLFSATLRH
jgi:hypothetical protein